MTITVLDADTLGFDDAAWQPVAALGDLTLHGQTPHTAAAAIEAAQGAEVVLTNKVPLTARVIEALPALRYIGVLATGYNIIDLEAAAARGIPVSNAPAYSTGSTAQHAVALILELCHRVGEHNASVQAGDWQRSPLFSYWHQPVRELTDRTVAVIGYGDIGRRVGDVMHALGARVVGVSRSRSTAPSWQPFAWMTFEDALAAADIVTLHCPQTPDTIECINRERLQRMQRHALLVNTARGTLIHEGDLAAALQAGTIAGAALDVVQSEPMAADCPLIGLPNCLITPHMAWSSERSRRTLLAITAGNIRGFQAGDGTTAPNQVA
ncbi:MAG: D-2-hydroxyacid dehydrogenase [Opitutales bacterium]